MKTLFLDTNIYLHYQFFDQIDWCKVADAESITIVVPPVTIRELQHHKDGNPSSRIAKRAGKVLVRLGELFASSSTATLRDGVALRFEDREPVIDPTRHVLNMTIQDDQLIASMLSHRESNPASTIVLVTADSGLLLKGKARRYDIEAIAPGIEYRLPEEPDPNQERIRALEQEIRELKATIPRLTLTFENGEQHVELTLSAPVELTAEEIQQKLSEIRDQHPTRDTERNSTDPDESVTKITRRALMEGTILPGSIAPDEISRYNAALADYYEAYEQYLRDLVRHSDYEARSAELVILVANEGTTPAEGIDIFMHFPDGFTLLAADDVPAEPQPPRLPDPPRTALQLLGNMTYRPPIEIPSSFLHHPGLDSSGPPPNVSPPTIRRTSSYEVDFRVRKLKHGFQLELDPLWVVFGSFAEAHSFGVEYHIHAENLPSAIHGKLNIVVKKQTATS